MNKPCLQLSDAFCAAMLLTALLYSDFGLAAEVAATSEPVGLGWIWDLLIAIIILAVAAGSAVVPFSALKQWTGQWRLGAALPLLMLLVWVGVIVVSKLVSAESHQLWPLEIFAWAMITMIYMVSLMTAKRMIEKKERENSQGK